MTPYLRLRRLGRYREIVQLVAAHGFGYLLADLPTPAILGRLVRRRSSEDLPRGVRLRHLLEELGPTFVKLGQLLSLRSDLLPEDVVRELEQLQDQVPPESAPAIRQVLESSLGRKAEEAFASFDWTPLAAASLGQVHAATLPDGRPVVVKVQRPGVRRVVEDDLAILSDLTRLFGRSAAVRTISDPEGLLEEMRRSLYAELDYTQEGRHADRLRRVVAGLPVVIPEVHWELTAPRVLTLQAVYGTKPTDPKAMAAVGQDPRRVARLAAQVVLHMIFEAGYFHADPHPGNLAVLGDGRLALYDFGMVGRLTASLREAFADLSAALLARDTEGVVAGILALGDVPPDVDMTALARDVEDLRDQYYEVPLPQIDLASAISDVLRVVYRHRVRIPKDLSLLAKALVTLEGLVSRLDPELSMVEVAQPFGRTLLRRRLSPQRWWRQSRSFLREAEGAARHLPRHVSRLAETVVRSGLPVRLSAADVERHLALKARGQRLWAVGVMLFCASLLMGFLLLARAIRPGLAPWPVAGAGWWVLPVLALAMWLIVRRAP